MEQNDKNIIVDLTFVSEVKKLNLKEDLMSYYQHELDYCQTTASERTEKALGSFFRIKFNKENVSMDLYNYDREVIERIPCLGDQFKEKKKLAKKKEMEKEFREEMEKKFREEMEKRLEKEMEKKIEYLIERQQKQNEEYMKKEQEYMKKEQEYMKKHEELNKRISILENESQKKMKIEEKK